MLFAETNVLLCSPENAINVASYIVDRRAANIENFFFIFLHEKNYQAGNVVEKKYKVPEKNVQSLL